jgi:hypothetical protein
MKHGLINRIAVILVLLAGINFVHSQTNQLSLASGKIQYLAIGDSYSIGEGATEPKKST